MYNYNYNNYYQNNPYYNLPRPELDKSDSMVPNTSHIMNPLQAFIAYWRNCFNFSDTAPRSEYWWINLMEYIMYSAINFYATGSLLFSTLSLTNLLSFSIFRFILILIFLVPNLSLNCRRLHDIGYSGWWQILLNVMHVIPFVGGLITLFGYIVIGLIPSNMESPYRDTFKMYGGNNPSNPMIM